MSESRTIAMPWYRPDEYGRLRALVTDAHAMAPTFEAWLASALNNERVAEEAGLTIRRVFLEPEAFAAWCAARSLPCDSNARHRFAREFAETA